MIKEYGNYRTVTIREVSNKQQIEINLYFIRRVMHSVRNRLKISKNFILISIFFL